MDGLYENKYQAAFLGNAHQAEPQRHNTSQTNGQLDGKFSHVESRFCYGAKFDPVNFRHQQAKALTGFIDTDYLGAQFGFVFYR